MSLTTSPPRVGELLRDWRRQRHLSQLDLSIEAEVSSRHLSFVETGRAKPSRELLLHLAEHLEVPLRDRNALLLAAGFAPVYRETPMDAEEMAPGARRIGQDPRRPRAVPGPGRRQPVGPDLGQRRRPRPAQRGRGPRAPGPPGERHAGDPAPRRPGPPHRQLRRSTAPTSSSACTARPCSPRIPAIADLLDELRGYPGVVEHTSAAVEPVALLFSPLRIEAPERRGAVFFSTLATFGTAVDITLAELSIERSSPPTRPRPPPSGADQQDSPSGAWGTSPSTVVVGRSGSVVLGAGVDGGGAVVAGGTSVGARPA